MSLQSCKTIGRQLQSVSYAHVNLERSIQRGVKEVHNFCYCWNSSKKSKRAIAIMLVVFAFGTYADYFQFSIIRLQKTEEIAAYSNVLQPQLLLYYYRPLRYSRNLLYDTGPCCFNSLAPMLKNAKLRPAELELEVCL